MSDAARAAYLVATALHAGFQVTVTLLVYPALARVRPAHWRELHDRHSRSIAPLVGVVYGALVVTAVWLLVVDRSPLAVAAVVPAALTLLVTAALAAPLHGRLARRDDVLVDRLLLVDRGRAGLALVAVVLAAVVVLA